MTKVQISGKMELIFIYILLDFNVLLFKIHIH